MCLPLLPEPLLSYLLVKCCNSESKDFFILLLRSDMLYEIKGLCSWKSNGLWIASFMYASGKFFLCFISLRGIFIDENFGFKFVLIF